MDKVLDSVGVDGWKMDESDYIVGAIRYNHYL